MTHRTPDPGDTCEHCEVNDSQGTVKQDPAISPVVRRVIFRQHELDANPNPIRSDPIRHLAQSRDSLSSNRFDKLSDETTKNAAIAITAMIKIRQSRWNI